MKPATGSSRFLAAMGAFAALGVLALATLEGPPRLATLAMLGGLALKTWIATFHRRREKDEEDRGNQEG